jgi:hypothetical protein
MVGALGEDALKVRINHGPVKRLPFTADSIRKLNATLGPFADPRQPRPAVPQRQRPQIHTVGTQKVESHVGRTTAAE